jgi:hypothetical protein
MYSWLWRILPGNKLMKALQSALLVGAILTALYFLVFPWLDALLYSEPTQGI